MSTLDALLTYLEELDGQLAQAVTSPQQSDCKLVKEVLFTKQQIRRHFRKNGNAFAEPASPARLEKFRAECGYNIDRLNERYRNAITCPRCSTTDVAVVKHMASVHRENDFDLHHNRRLKLVYDSGMPGSGKFCCNSCSTRFDPTLPPHIARLCEMLYAYYE